MKALVLAVLVSSGAASAQIVIEAPASRTITEDVALGRCIAAINLAGKRPADAPLPKVKARTGNDEFLFRWKTASGFMNCQISTDKRGKMTVFSTAS